MQDAQIGRSHLKHASWTTRPVTPACHHPVRQTARRGCQQEQAPLLDCHRRWVKTRPEIPLLPCYPQARSVCAPCSFFVSLSRIRAQRVSMQAHAEVCCGCLSTNGVSGSWGAQSRRRENRVQKSGGRRHCIRCNRGACASSSSRDGRGH
jgi:hypothetical protein